MTWKDDRVTASLGGVEFIYREVGRRGGRRNVVFEYPGRDTPYVEELGRSALRFQVRALLIGPNYHVARNDLIEVLEGGGELTFVHPLQGELGVKLDGDYNLRESDREGGVATFDFTLVESGKAFPLIAVDTGAELQATAAALQTALAENTKFSLVGAISDAVGSALAALGKASSALRKVNGKIGATLSLIDDATFLVNDFEKQLNTLVNTPQALMNKLTALQTAVLGLVKNFRPDPSDVANLLDPPSAVDALLGGFREMNRFEPDDPVIPTPTNQSRIEVAALDEIQSVTRLSALAATGDALPEVSLDSADQAASIMTELVAAADAGLETEALAEETLQALAAFKAALVEHLTNAQQRLPRLATFTPVATVPALLVAYELYGDPERDIEVIRRNLDEHPLFLPGGIDLEVTAGGD